VTGTERTVTPNLLRDWPLPDPGSGKYGRGQVVVIGGAARTPGAAMLAALAALRVGAGRLTLAVAASTAPHVAVAIPEAGVEPLAEDDDGHVAAGALAGLGDDLAPADAVLVGPGLDEPEGTRGLVLDVVRQVGDTCTVILDAFALGVAADLAADLEPLAGRLVMTPNRGEAARLLQLDGDDDLDDDDRAVVASIAERYGAVVSFQGVVAEADGTIWSTGTGTGGLGTSGSGDVLSGAIAGLAARGATGAQAAVWATHAHAAAGDRLAVEVGPMGYLARELLTELPRVLVELGG
jgi:hydroxyethylthiazole kinase-like uncharacterized protein yjeF